jgi:hypothetical protein
MSEEKRAELRQKVRELRGLVTGEKAQQICADMERLIEQLSFITTTTVIGSIPPKPWIVYGLNTSGERAACVFLAPNPGAAERTAQERLKLAGYDWDKSIVEVREPVTLKLV